MPAGFHHVAFACRDLDATHKFYAETLELPLVHTELAKVGDGWFRHVFYDLGNGAAIAFFDLHGAGEPTPTKTAISTDLGLPLWVNHVALRVDPETQARLSKRITDSGLKLVMEFDHGWCRSVYVRDPNGILLELCADKPEGMPADPDAAEKLRHAIPDGATVKKA